LVIHNISLPPGQFGGPYIADLFGNQLDVDADASFASLQGVKVSAHFLIQRDGSLLQFVSTRQRAWHAGVSHFEGRSRCNDYSIGVELEGSDFVPFDEAQYNRLVELTYCLQMHHPLRAVCGHQHIAPGRKTDPGPCFNWPAYHSQWMILGGRNRAPSGLQFPSPA
jgi:AmpD protein